MAGERQQERRESRVRLRAVDGGSRKDPARDARGSLGALEVAAQPEEIVCDPGRQLRSAARQLDRRARRPQQADRPGPPLAGDPGVLAASAALHGHDQRVALERHAREPPRHHLPGAAAGRGREGAQHEMAWLDEIAIPDRRRRERHLLLRHEGVWLRANLRDQRFGLGGGEPCSEGGLHLEPREGGLDHQLREVILDVGERVLVPAPPGGDRGQGEILGEQRAAQAREEGEQGRRLDQTASERVGHREVSGAHRLHQPGDTERRVAAQRERIAERVVHPAQQHVHRLESPQRLEVERAVADREVSPLHEGQAEIAGQIGVLEIRLVVGPGGEQPDAGIVAVARGERAQRVAQALEEAREPLHPALAEGLGQRARDHQPVLECVSGARGCLGPVGEHPPLSVRRAREVGGVELEPAASLEPRPVTRPQVARVREDQPRRQQPLAQQPLRPIEIGEDRVEQPRPLGERRAHRLPLGFGRDQRDGIQLPGPIHSARVAVDVVGDAVLVDQPARGFPTARHLGASHRVERAHEGIPVGARAAGVSQHLVVQPGEGLVVEPQRIGPGHRRAAQVRRRSRVKGYSGSGFGVATTILPGVCPRVSNRETRRDSASLAFTGKLS